jgi:hypothetical protein
MAFVLSTDNAIAFAQVRLRGGWRNLAVTFVAYTVLLGATMIATAAYSYRPTMAYAGWVTGLLWLQAGILLIFGATRVAGAIRADIAGGMIESHRLMPLSAGQAVVGYFFGSTCQAIALGVANLLIGAVAVRRAGLPMDRWLTVNAVLALFCLLVWAMGGLLAFAARGAGFALFLPLAAVSMTQGLVLATVPALAVLVSPLAGGSIFSFSAGIADPPFTYGLGAIAQLFFAGILFVGCCRKYRRADAQGITAGLGLVLLAAWVIVSSLGIRQWAEFEPRYLQLNPDPETQLIGSIIATMLLALLPVSAAAQADADWRRRRRAADSALRRRPIPPGAVVAAATLITLALVNVEWGAAGTTGAAGRSDASLPAALAGASVQTAAVVCLFLLSLSYLLRISYRARGKPLVVGLGWMILTWLIPIVTELMVLAVRGYSPDQTFPGTIATCSPPVTVYCAWRPDARINDRGQSVAIALAVQGGLTVFLALLYYGRAPKAHVPRPAAATGGAAA